MWAGLSFGMRSEFNTAVVDCHWVDWLSVRHFCTCSSLTTVTPNKTIITACVQQHCALLTQNCSELSLRALSNGSRHIQMIKHLHPLKDIIRRAPPAYYFHFCAFGAIDRCGCTPSAPLGREKHPPKSSRSILQ